MAESNEQSPLTPVPSSTNEVQDDDEELDPRVQIELERLNHANEAINQLELQLDVNTSLLVFGKN